MSEIMLTFALRFKEIYELPLQRQNKVIDHLKTTTIMNKTQEQLLAKQFKVNEHFAITRADYENMPDPMVAFTWSDERMEELARRIAPNLYPYDEKDPEGMEDDFWKEMEDEAVRMGMEYYEDFTDEEVNSINAVWNNIK